MNNEIIYKLHSLKLAKFNKNVILTNNEYKFYDMLIEKCKYPNNGFRNAIFVKEDIECFFTHNRNLSVNRICNTLEKYKRILLQFTFGEMFGSSSAISQYKYDDETGEFMCSISNHVYNALIDFYEPNKDSREVVIFKNEEYKKLIDLGIHRNMHLQFINDFADYRKYPETIGKAVDKTCNSILGGKSVNSQNYKYFKAVLKNLMPTD